MVGGTIGGTMHISPPMVTLSSGTGLPVNGRWSTPAAHARPVSVPANHRTHTMSTAARAPNTAPP